MVRFLFIGLILMVPGELLGSVLPEIAFMQAPTTAQRTDPLPGGIGVPPSDNNRYLQELMRQGNQGGATPAQTAPGQQGPGQGQQPPGQAPGQARSSARSAFARGPASGAAAAQFFRRDRIYLQQRSNRHRHLDDHEGARLLLRDRSQGHRHSEPLHDDKTFRGDRMFEILEQVLKMNGQGIVRQDDMYVIAPLPEGPREPHKIL